MRTPRLAHDTGLDRYSGNVRGKSLVSKELRFEEVRPLLRKVLTYLGEGEVAPKIANRTRKYIATMGIVGRSYKRVPVIRIYGRVWIDVKLRGDKRTIFNTRHTFGVLGFRLMCTKTEAAKRQKTRDQEPNRECRVSQVGDFFFACMIVNIKCSQDGICDRCAVVCKDEE